MDIVVLCQKLALLPDFVLNGKDDMDDVHDVYIPEWDDAPSPNTPELCFTIYCMLAKVSDRRKR